MKLLSATFLLASSSVVSAALRGAGLEREQDKQESIGKSIDMNDNDNANAGQESNILGGSSTEVGEEEGDDGDDADLNPPADNDTLEEVEDELDGDEGMQRGFRLASYSKYSSKGCRNYHGDNGSSHHDYDLYRHVDRHFCKSKCNKLGHQCYGYEYSHSGKCEVWRVPIYYVDFDQGEKK